MVRAVIDTNVLVSALMRCNDDTPPAKVLNDFRHGVLVLLYDERMMGEYQEVLQRPKFGLDPRLVDELLELIRELGEPIDAAAFPGEVLDPDDRPFVDVAFTGRADILITGNVKDFPVGDAVRVITPRDWVEERNLRVIMTP